MTSCMLNTSHPCWKLERRNYKEHLKPWLSLSPNSCSLIRCVTWGVTALTPVLSKTDSQQQHDFPTFYSLSFIILFSHSSPQLFPSPSNSRRVAEIHRLIHGMLPHSPWHSPTLAVAPYQQKLCNFYLFQLVL